MTFQQISQRGKEYLRTAETLLRAAQTMTDLAIARQLKALADEYPCSIDPVIAIGLGWMRCRSHEVRR
jgi:hypothetical protein